MAATKKRIATAAKVRSYTRTGEGLKLTFKGLVYTGDHHQLLDWWIDNNVTVTVTIEANEQLLVDGPSEQ